MIVLELIIMNNLIQGVGFRGITEEQNVLFWVNDVPGMSEELVTSVNNREDIVDFISQLHAITAPKFRRMVMGVLSKSCDWKQVLSKFPRSSLPAKPEFYTPENVVCRINCGAGSKYTMVRLKEVVFSAKSAGSATLSIFKLPFMELVQEVEVNVLVGKNKISVSFPDWSDETVYQGIVLQLVSPGVQLYALERESLAGNLEVTDTFIDGEDAPAFLLCDAHVASNLDALIDTYSLELSEAYAYLLAANLLEYKLSSYKLSLFTNSKRQDSEFRSTQYPKEAELSIKAISNTLSDEITSAQFVPYEPVSTYSLGTFNVFEDNDY